MTTESTSAADPPRATFPSYGDVIAVTDLWDQRRIGIRHLDELHGLQTAVAIGPRPIPQAAWLAVVWGHRGRPSALQRRQIDRMRGPILRMYNLVAASLCGDAPEPYQVDLNGYRPPFDPFYAEDLDLPAEIWCRGFYQGMRLDPKNWRWLSQHEPQLMRPIWVFGTPEGLRYRETCSFGYDKAVAMWAERLEPAVFAIREYWRRRSHTKLH